MKLAGQMTLTLSKEKASRSRALNEALAKGLADSDAGRVLPIDEAFARIRARLEVEPCATEDRQQGTFEALADVDAGRVIDHESVRAWSDSLGSDDPLPVPR